MTLTYVGDLSTSLDLVRFYLNDTTANSGPRPAEANYSDEELGAIITAEGSWQRAVGVMLDVLATEWSRHADITVGPRHQSFSQVAEAYAKRAAKWRVDNNVYPGIHTAGVIRVDGYSDDVASNDVDAGTEYARIKIRTWEYPL